MNKCIKKLILTFLLLLLFLKFLKISLVNITDKQNISQIIIDNYLIIKIFIYYPALIK